MECFPDEVKFSVKNDYDLSSVITYKLNSVITTAKRRESFLHLLNCQILDVYVLEGNKEWEKLAAKLEKVQKNLAASKVGNDIYNI